MNDQLILTASERYKELDIYVRDNGLKKIFLVCGNSLHHLKIKSYFELLEERLGVQVIKFNHFQANPRYESVVEGVALFRKERCDSIIAVGGGSAMDVAKCIKLYCNLEESGNYLKHKIIPNDIAFLVVPTTAGTGSEATRFAVIYYKGEKQSVSDESCIPSAVLFDPSALETLPAYQKKSTLMDAFCHAIESCWSINSNTESQEYSKEAIGTILCYKDAYLANEKIGNAAMLKAANLAGKAINITQTTAAHAMCYKLTSLYGIAHGHAAALCLSKLFPYMADNIDKCVEPRGKEYLKIVFGSIAKEMECTDLNEAAVRFNEMLIDFGLETPKVRNVDYDMLVKSVNPVRLKNNPIKLDEESINRLYHQILQAK